MKAVILAGGRGTRFREETHFKPKPLIEVGTKPIILHLIEHLYFQGIKEFYIAGGYKINEIKNYFLNLNVYNSDVKIDYKTGKSDIILMTDIFQDLQINVIDTGIDSKTAERILKLKDYLKDETFLCTYGDGLANIDINALINFHNEKKQVATVTACHPIGRFGELNILDNQVIDFNEKPISNVWINAGFFVFEKQIFNFLDNDQMLEEEPMKKLVQSQELNAYKHYDFWQPMDTYRDWLVLEELWNSGKAPWKIW